MCVYRLTYQVISRAKIQFSAVELFIDVFDCCVAWAHEDFPSFFPSKNPIQFFAYPSPTRQTI
jgi:hypothetical protein